MKYSYELQKIWEKWLWTQFGIGNHLTLIGCRAYSGHWTPAYLTCRTFLTMTQPSQTLTDSQIWVAEITWWDVLMDSEEGSQPARAPSASKSSARPACGALAFSVPNPASPPMPYIYHFTTLQMRVPLSSAQGAAIILPHCSSWIHDI
jgi:hypothetical protein